jgi:CHAT domain-containing protein
LQEYKQALKFLHVDKYPEKHLEVLQELLTLRRWLFNPKEAQNLLNEATAKLETVLEHPQLKLGQKQTLRKKFPEFNQLQVYALAQADPIQALELAEKHKNCRLKSLRSNWPNEPPNITFTDFQKFLNSQSAAAIYWHVSPAGITTLILKSSYSKPKILKLFQEEIAHQAPRSEQEEEYNCVAKQLEQFKQWMKRWKEDYIEQRSSQPTEAASSTWRSQMENMLCGEDGNLKQILEIDHLCKEHLQDVKQLILIPHRDLHLLPLHALFPENLSITYLPSAQFGLDLQQRESIVGDQLLIVGDPVSTSDGKKKQEILKYSKRESEKISQFYKDTKSSHLIGTTATKSSVIEALGGKYDCFHFTGHGCHDIENPEKSALLLADQDHLTLRDIFNLDLQSYSLVCLSTCESGITSNSKIIDEYVGLVSGFLSAGAAHVISTLWSVDELSSSLLMIEFHRLVRDRSLPPAQALREAQHWLRHEFSYHDLSNLYETIADEFGKIDPGCNEEERFKSLSRKTLAKAKSGEFTEPPFAHPYHWAGFIITGKVPKG